MKSRSVAWLKYNPIGAEFADVMLGPDMLSAVGVAIGGHPFPYRLDYTLQTSARFVTSRLCVATRGQGWRRSLDLTRAASGAWSAVTEMEGNAPLGLPGGDVQLLDGAFDCDLGLSPLTNSMPVLRHDLLAGGRAIDFLMAWVSVPDLSVHLSKQRYMPLQSNKDRHIIRFEDSDGFVADLTFDNDGLVLNYPGLACRLAQLG